MIEHLTKIGIAVILGIFLGWEREQSNKDAGLRTTTLVMLGATLFTIISVILREVGGNYDIGRIMAYTIAGIGFLGTGIISKEKNGTGVTTASLLWAVVGIGILCGLGEFSLAIISALVIYLILKLKYFRIKISTIKKRKRRKS